MNGKGKVIAVSEGNALIRVVRRSACDACEGKAACESSLIGDCTKNTEITVLAANDVDAKIGDAVEYTSSTAMTLGIAFAVFIVPLIFGFVSYFVSEAILGGFNVILPYAISFFFFILSCVGLFFGIDHALKGKIKVRVSKILSIESEQSL